jgi:hypothetical protein
LQREAKKASVINDSGITSRDSNSMLYGSKQFKAEASPRMVLALTSVAEVDGAI